MPLILDTPLTNTWITHISEDVRKHLVIVCPYLKINDRLRRIIEIAVSRGVKLYIVYGKGNMDHSTMSWLKGLRNTSIGYIPNLHAKIYLTEGHAIVTSMNLYEFSQVNNEEIGVLLGYKEDRRDYKAILFHTMRLLTMAEKEHGAWNLSDIDKPLRGLFGTRKTVFDNDPTHEELETDDSENIHISEEPNEIVPERILCRCIRCNRIIPSDHQYVYCGRCMESWSRYCNTGYVENEGHCYICGKDIKSSAAKPACADCYRSNKQLVDLKCSIMASVKDGLLEDH